ncbi:MAG: GAF domain-containing protein [Anaerolineae bacterium]|nr:GAF domain-containing protein [Anaerolineae bacterium]
MMAERENTLISRIDPRTFPIALKITLGLAFLLLISGLIVNFLFQQALQSAQVELALDNLQVHNRNQALRITEALRQKILILDRLGSEARIEQALNLRQDESSDDTATVFTPDTTIDSTLNAFMEEHEEFETIAVMDGQRHVLSIATDELPDGFDTRKMPATPWEWYTNAWNNGPYIAGHINEPLTEKQGVHIALPIYSTESPNKTLGILYAVWNMQDVPELTNSESGNQTLIIEQDGTAVLLPDRMNEVDMPPDLTGNSQSGAFLFNDTWFYSYVSMRELSISDPSLDNLPWVFATRRSISTALSGTAQLINILRWATGISAILIIVLTLLFSRSLLLPLNRLTDAITEIGRGELHTPIPQSAPDEIGRLSYILSKAIAGLLSRVEQLRAAVQVSHTTMMTLEIDRMLEEVAQSLSRYFDYQDVRVFLVDPSGRRARLQAAIGEESERLLQAGFRVEIDDSTLIGRSIMLNEALVSAGKEELRETGPNTRYSEITLPIQTSGDVKGAIHLLTGRMREFSREDMNILRLIADQLSAAIQNARLFEQSAANLAEIEALNRRLTRQAWEEFMGEGGSLRHTLDPEELWPQALEKARQSSEVKAEVYTDADGRSVLAAPLVSRGETVGTLAVTRPSGDVWTRDEALLLESIAARMGIIAESIRLVEESTQRVEREQRVNEVSANLLQRASSVDTVLRSALNELSEALGSDRVSLRLGGLPARDGRQISAGFTDEQSDNEDAFNASETPDTDGDGGITNV